MTFRVSAGSSDPASRADRISFPSGPVYVKIAVQTMTMTTRNQARGAETAQAHSGTDAGPTRARMRDLLSSPLRAAETRPVATLTLVGVVFTIAYLIGVLGFPSGSGRVLNGDAIQYFAYVQSAVVDGDLDFSNDYRQLYGNTAPETNVWLRSRTPAGRVPNLMSVGPAILWSPFYVAARLVLGAVEPGERAEALLHASVGVAGIFYATLGAWFTFWACALLFPRRAAFWATLVVWLAGPAIYYSSVSPAYSHATSFFAVALFVYVWLRTRAAPGYGRTILLGALAGLVAMVRWQDSLVLLLPVVEALVLVCRRQASVVAVTIKLALLVLTAGFVSAPQFLAWQAIYGTPLVMPQGAGFMVWTSPAILGVLFSLKRGLFSWTPALLPAVAGLPLVIRRDRLAGWSIVLVLALSVYVNGAVQDWWAGEAFGARRFIGDGVFFALGLSAVMALPQVARRPGIVQWISVAAIAYNVLFLFQYQLFMRGMRDLVPYPETARQIFVDRLWLPFQLLLRWVSG